MPPPFSKLDAPCAIFPGAAPAPAPQRPQTVGRQTVKWAISISLFANVREALERHDVPAHNGAAGSAVSVPRTEAARRVELASQFAARIARAGWSLPSARSAPGRRPRESSRVATPALKAPQPARRRGGHRQTMPRRSAAALERAGISVIRTTAIADDQARAELRGNLARCDLAVIEARLRNRRDPARLAMVATPERPGLAHVAALRST